MSAMLHRATAFALCLSCVACRLDDDERDRARDEDATFNTGLPERGPTTDGDIAVRNLEGELSAVEQRLSSGDARPDDGPRLVALYRMRAQFLGRIEDDERALAIANGLVDERAGDPESHRALAGVKGRLHRFDEALAHLEDAEALGAGVDAERLKLHEELDPTPATLEALLARAERERTFETHSAASAALARRGAIDAADVHALAAYRAYRDVSPFVVAWLEFQYGLLQERRLDFVGARAAWSVAFDRLPAFAAAGAHRAEVEAREGRTDVAIRLFRSAWEQTGNPEYAGQLAAALAAVDDEEADEMLAAAREGYVDWVERHPAATADHAARFWLGVGDDVARAHELAVLNRSVRRGPESMELLIRSALVAGRTDALCAELAALRDDERAIVGDALLAQGEGACDDRVRQQP